MGISTNVGSGKVNGISYNNSTMNTRISYGKEDFNAKATKIDFGNINNNDDSQSSFSIKRSGDVDNIDLSSISINFDEIRSKVDIFKNSASKDIFKSSYFGADQNAIGNILEKLYFNEGELSEIERSKADTLNSIIENYYPGIDDMLKYEIGQKFSATGCEYITIASALAVYLGSMDNGNSVFKDKFGFDMTFVSNGEVNYQVEAMALDIFLDCWSKYATPEALVTDAIDTGVYQSDFDPIFKTYFQEHGMNIENNYQQISIDSDLADKIGAFLASNSEGFNYISSSNCNIQFLDGVDKSIIGYSGIIDGGHSMLMTGLDEFKNPIVSTWGMEATFDVNKLIENYNNNPKITQFIINNINISMNGGN